MNHLGAGGRVVGGCPCGPQVMAIQRSGTRGQCLDVQPGDSSESGQPIRGVGEAWPCGAAA